MKQNKSLVIGLTGGIGSGKSTVVQFLLALGYPVVDSDLLAREIVEPGSEALIEIEKAFGSEYILSTGCLDRKKLGNLVFSHPDQLEILNAITSEKISHLLKSRVELLKKEHEIIFVDVPLLIERGQIDYYDEIWLVYVPRHVQLIRLMERDGISLEFAEKQLAAQMPIEDKIPYADRVINNESDKIFLREQVLCAVEALINQ